jgi:cell division protein FtsL
MISDFHKKQKGSKPFNKILLFLGIILCIVIFCLLIVANIKIYQRRQELSLQLENLKKQTEEIKNNNNQLKEGIQKATDSDYIEKIAREQLNLQKSNETATVFLMPKVEEGKVENQNNQNNWFGKIWQNIISIFK